MEPKTSANITIEMVEAAMALVSPLVKRTPSERSETLSGLLGTNVFVKYELFQRAGSFKVRGAFNKLLNLTDEERSRGVVAVSGGNHAQAVAYTASRLGVDAVIVMPENTPKLYLDATTGYGAKIHKLPTIADAFAMMEEYQTKGRVVIHPFDDPLVIAGQGTVGLEISEDVPDATDIFVSIGGGGLAAGIAIAVKAHKAGVRVWGVETEGANAMALALEAGRPVTLSAITSIAKTLGAPFVTELTLGLIRDLLEGVTVVSDAEAVDSMILILERLKVITEPAASCTLAAALRHKHHFGPDENVVLVFCGGNTGAEDLCRYLADLK
ncbi:MAG TPA: threonine/serine dehydratase [Pyrinomonadaceae bacterium]|nr:threonine/serine dehydratase [Pyrinomonadaceae bacterium]